jgi:hypothetical protein
VVEEQLDVIVVGDVQDPEDLDDALTRTGADLVIWEVHDDEDVDRCAFLFDGHPRLTVLALLHDGREGFLWQLRPHRMVLGELSPRQLPEAIRRAMRHQTS